MKDGHHIGTSSSGGISGPLLPTRRRCSCTFTWRIKRSCCTRPGDSDWRGGTFGAFSSRGLRCIRAYAGPATRTRCTREQRVAAPRSYSPLPIAPDMAPEGRARASCCTYTAACVGSCINRVNRSSQCTWCSNNTEEPHKTHTKKNKKPTTTTICFFAVLQLYTPHKYPPPVTEFSVVPNCDNTTHTSTKFEAI